ncbi:MAG: 16S rRNA (guanine(966)-N(2))-methyltransferase RsmD [Planctomycetes bacterium]|nr:16S rRNA (guanine(966)-N(2))-methyltransferase RsmD [Planctomycetota bacterium]
MSHRRGIRIASGTLRGRTLDVPPGLQVRPMRTRVREAFFNHLGTRLRGARFLDVFSGSGAIGIEAFSRGAAEVVLVENAREVTAVLRRNLQNLDLGRRCRLLDADIYREGWPQLRAEQAFDIVFLDPPFPTFRESNEKEDPRRLLVQLATSAVLRAGGLIGHERPTDIDSPSDPPGTRVEFRRSYGDTTLEVWEKCSA